MNDKLTNKNSGKVGVGRFITSLVAAVAFDWAAMNVLADPFVPLAWQTRVKTGPLANQFKHVGWIRDRNGDFIDDAFDALPAGQRTTAIVQVSQCLDPAGLTNHFSRFGTVRSTGTLVAYVVIDGVLKEDLAVIASDPIVAAVQKPIQGRFLLDTSAREIRARSSEYNGGTTVGGITSGGQDFRDLAPTLDLSKFTRNPDGSGINIAIVDTGVDDGFHAAFGSRFIAGFDATTSPGTPGNPTDDDMTYHHGTHVAGIALGAGLAGVLASDGDRPPLDEPGTGPSNNEGVAPSAGLIDVKVGTPVGMQDLITDDTVLLRALEWIWMSGQARVVNLGLGFDGQNDGSEPIAQAVNALVDRGMVVVVAMGNSGLNILPSPAGADLAITVAAADDKGTVAPTDDTIASFSTYGPRADLAGNLSAVLADPSLLTEGMLKPDLAAPGTAIDSAKGGGPLPGNPNPYQQLSGSSMAAAHVAGAAALILGIKNDIPPGALKDLLKRAAFKPDDYSQPHGGSPGGPVFPTLDPIWNDYWGYGLLDVWNAANLLQFPVTDLGFSLYAGANPGYPTVRPCLLTGHADHWWENNVDITLDTDPPQQGHLNNIHVKVTNFGASDAHDVVVCASTAVCGDQIHNYNRVGCKKIATVPGHGFAIVTFPWKPQYTGHECIIASIDYGLDSDFRNNVTQRNTSPVNVGSPATANFYVSNPFNEPATVRIQLQADLSSRTNFSPFLLNTNIDLGPADCAKLQTIQFYSRSGLAIGTTGQVSVASTLFNSKYTNGIKTSGVTFNLLKVAAGLDSAYSVAAHGPQGELDLALNIAGQPTTDPRKCVQKVRAVFKVPVMQRFGSNIVTITRQSGGQAPSYTASFAGGASVGRELTIQFTQPLTNNDVYTFEFYGGVQDADGSQLTGDSNFQLRVLRGDVNSSGLVTAADVSFVRGLTNKVADFGNTALADVNLDGIVNQDDVDYVSDQISANRPHVRIALVGPDLRLSWDRPEFRLQTAPTLIGPWSNASLPLSVDLCGTATAIGNITNSMMFFRLCK